jgi:cytochrome o ubiquinol oxidase subunit II
MQLIRVTAGVLAILNLAACGGVLDPQGPIGAAEKLILLDSLAIMLVIVVPVIIAAAAFSFWFRAGNPRAKYLPNWSFSGHLELLVWAIPALVVTFLGGIAWYGSHALDPYKPLPSGKPLEIEVVSLDWKWLFIYPDLGVATVNQLTIPVGVPLHFRLTSAGVMNSFFVPQLGGQMYTMAGMTSQLNLQADRPGSYAGLSAQFSGEGFADMHFNVSAISVSGFDQWVVEAKRSMPLDAAAYALLARSSKNVAAATFRLSDASLFDSVVHIGPVATDPQSVAAAPRAP